MGDPELLKAMGCCGLEQRPDCDRAWCPVWDDVLRSSDYLVETGQVPPDLHPGPPLPQRTCVYRLFDRYGQLLYVGVSGNLGYRLQGHQRDRGDDWLHVVRIELEWFGDRPEALLAEAQAIRTEDPMWNIAGKEPG